METTESIEDYLEAILVISKKLPAVKAVDIVNYFNYSKSSVSIAVKNLKEKGYLTVENHGYITLTEKGSNLAIKTYEKHIWLTNWLISLGVSEDTASKDACRMEHTLSEETFEKLKENYSK